MRRFFGKERRPSTIIRDNMVHTAYEEVCNEIGEYVHLVPRQYIYEKVRERTGLCLKTIAYILNNTVKQKLTIGGGVIFNILIYTILQVLALYGPTLPHSPLPSSPCRAVLSALASPVRSVGSGLKANARPRRAATARIRQYFLLPCLYSLSRLYFIFCSTKKSMSMFFSLQYAMTRARTSVTSPLTPLNVRK